MARSVEAKIEPDLLVWARERAGFTVEEAARKLRDRADRQALWVARLKDWEAGLGRPTISQLRTLGKAYKRPLAFFYLPEPPKDFQAINDYRMLADLEPAIAPGSETHELRYEVRRAYERREIALDLFGEELPGFPLYALRASLGDDTERLAEELRAALGVDLQAQRKWGTRSEALNRWRALFERAGVLVFQAPGIDLDEMRGFSISQMPLPVVVLNNKDSYAARVFSMLHELTHIVIHDNGLCNLRRLERLPGDKQAVEMFCNYVAGAALVPKKHLVAEGLVRRHKTASQWSDADIEELAHGYGVSRTTLVRRLLICKLTTSRFYEEKQEQYRREYEAWRKKPREGFASPDRKAIANAGLLFSDLVLTSYYEDRITLSDVSEFLGVRLKHLPKIEESVAGHSARLRAAS